MRLPKHVTRPVGSLEGAAAVRSRNDDDDDVGCGLLRESDARRRPGHTERGGTAA